MPEITFSINNNGLHYSSSSGLGVSYVPKGFALASFSQYNNISNNHDSILDLVFSNFNDLKIEPTTEPLVQSDLYHPHLISNSMKWHLNVNVYMNNYSGLNKLFMEL